MIDKIDKIDSLYSKYFQKSRSFLYPALGIRKASDFPPSGIYMAIEGVIQIEDIKLICTYKNNDSEEFKKFEQKMLLENPLFYQKIQVRDYSLYLFDFQSFTNDWFNVIMGKYSKLTYVLKKAIKEYYGENSTEYKYIHSYLYPDKYYELYAELLDVDVTTLKSLGELCDPCDTDKETLKIPVEDLEMLKKMA